MIKVAHLTTVDLSLRFLVLPQLQSISALGHQSIGISAPGPWVTEIENLGIRHIPLSDSTRGFALVKDLRAIFQLWRILRQERIDILHTHNPKPGLYGRVLGRLAGVPIVVNTVHGLYATEDDPLPKRFLVYALEGMASWFSDAELVQSSEDLALIRRMPFFARRKARFLGNGVDLVRFRPEGSPGHDRTSARAALGIGEEQVAVGIVGRLVAEKGFPEFFEAIRSLDSSYVVLVVGPDDPEKNDSLPATLIERAQADGVRFLGMRTDVDDLYRALDIFVLPSHREGFPRSAMEAAASGVPVIATDIRGCREVVTNGLNGLLVPVRDPKALEQAIKRLGQDPVLRRQMGVAAVSRAKEHFDEERVVSTVLDTYRRVAREKGLSVLISALSTGDETARIRVADLEDARSIARLHGDNITGGFLSSLGVLFLEQLYRSMIAWPGAVILVADAGFGPIGFVAGIGNTGDFYRHFLLRRGVVAGLVGLPRLIRPSNLKRAIETLTYPSTGADQDAELLSMAVDRAFRGRGVASRLGRELLARIDATVRVVVGAENSAAIAAYQRLGFDNPRPFQVHLGEPSLVLTWRQT
ncbi:MAG TPA: GNAT family N-acetyltransferase [Acidimicrobiia bacterium]|nr:GNAT family N-acetyltransferase [Acidimicrobiia bacterium]